MLYLFSDGFQDQIGGTEKIKFMRKPFQELLVSIHDKPMAEQKNLLENAIHSWIGGGDQMDDILIIGVRI
jgi:serine phosphatase RsbU (regulator of sigma subunit)